MKEKRRQDDEGQGGVKETEKVESGRGRQSEKKRHEAFDPTKMSDL